MLRRKLRWFCLSILELSKQCPNIQGNLETFERSTGAQSQLRILGTWIGVTSLAGVDRQREEGGCTACGIYPEHILHCAFSKVIALCVASIETLFLGHILWTFLHCGTACGIHRGSLGIGRLNLVESSVGNPLNLADTLHILPVATLSPSWGL